MNQVRIVPVNKNIIFTIDTQRFSLGLDSRLGGNDKLGQVFYKAIIGEY
jgi:hypothetical protein